MENILFGFNEIAKAGLNRNSFGLLKDTKNFAKKKKDEEKEEILKLDPKDIKQVDFPDHLYFREQTPKKQIVLHHTVSGRGVEGDINWWKENPQRIATAIIVKWNGKKFQLFSSNYWAHHLGIRQNFLKSQGFSDYKTRNRLLNSQSIGIEIDAWGGLVENNGKWYPAKWDGGKYVANTRISPVENVTKYPEGYREFYGFETYTDEQIESVRKLLIYFSEKHDIPLGYNRGVFEVSGDALSGKPGVWSHTSYRPDKSDVHPQPELIDMLKSL